MAESLNRDLYEQLVRGLAQGRHKTEAEIRALIDHGPFLPEDAVRAGLIDDVAYEDELDDKVQLAAESVRYLHQQDYRHVAPQSLGLNRGQRIARDLCRRDHQHRREQRRRQRQVVGSDTIVGYLRQVRADNSIKAIVLRIDSPGGSAIASDVIWREVMLTRESQAGDRLDVGRRGLGRLLHRDAGAPDRRPAGTLTGSIGVVMIKFVIDGTLEKLGMNMEARDAGAVCATSIRRSRPFSPEERAEGPGADAGDLRRLRREGGVRPQDDAGADRRDRAGTRVDRQAGEGARARRRARRPPARAGARQGAREDRRRTRKWSWSSTRSGGRSTSWCRRRSALGSAGVLGGAARVRDRRAVQTLTAPLRVFRRGEPLAIMPNVFVRR